jgi:glycosyltransferase involved in cell wall biosynthesis
MRIVYIVTGLNIGGAERAVYNIITNGLDSKYVIKIVSLRDMGHYGAKFESSGIDVSCLNLQNPLNLFSGIVKLFKLTREFEPDLVQGWMYHGNIFSLLVCLFARVKPKVFWGIRHTIYDIRKEKFLTRLVIKLEAKFSFFVNAIIYNSKKSQNQHESIGFSKKNGIYIPNGFDFSVWKFNDRGRKKMKEELRIPDNSFVIGYIGRYHKMKNIELLFKVMVNVLSKNPNLRFLVIGKNTDIKNSKLKPYYNRLPPEQVISLGERTDIPEVIQCIDLLCLTSTWGEGFPNVIGEAMASRIPCIATDIGDSSLIIGETGWVIPSNDAKLLTNSIDLALSESTSSYALRSLSARKRILAFSIENIVNQYDNIYSHG